MAGQAKPIGPSPDGDREDPGAAALGATRAAIALTWYEYDVTGRDREIPIALALVNPFLSRVMTTAARPAVYVVGHGSGACLPCQDSTCFPVCTPVRPVGVGMGVGVDVGVGRGVGFGVGWSLSLSASTATPVSSLDWMMDSPQGCADGAVDPCAGDGA